MEFRILGPLEVADGDRVIPLGGAKQRALLALLLLSANEPVSSDRLIDELWGEQSPESGRTALQVRVSQLRKALGGAGAAILTRAPGYVLRVEEEDQLDLHRFERLVREADEAEPVAAAAKLREALALWRGPALADLAYEAFAQPAIRRLEELRLASSEKRIDADLACGRHAELVGELETLVAEHPLRERPHAQLMLTLYRCGRQADALDAYQRARTHLSDQLGLEPGPALRGLEQSILRQDPSLQLAPVAADRSLLAVPLEAGMPLRRRGSALETSEGADLPVGVVTLLFSDIEGSTWLLQALGEAYGEVLAGHHRLLREVWPAHGGVEVDTVGDAVFVAFADPTQALGAAGAAQSALSAHTWPPGGEVRVRMGVHTGSPRVRDRNYWGIDVHYAAQLCSAAHGGQVLVSESTAGLVDAALEDLGEHALKNFPSPRRLFHLLVDGRGKDCFPAPRTRRSGKTNLPDQLSTFVGREGELVRLRGLLATARLVTLTGAGGVGKTRLALQVGAELLDGTGDGVWFVNLAPLADPALVATTLAKALGVSVQPGRDVLDALGDALSGREVLIVLDNCEHVVDAAATVVAGLLGRCPGVSVLATSREPLRIAGEHVYRVPSLSTPPEDVEDLSRVEDSEAVQLFTARAAQQRPGFAVSSENAAAVARVCRRLDGIPLAIELAEVRLRSMSIADLDARLDHRFSLLKAATRTAVPRQQTLLSLIDWSYDLLSEPERAVLMRLAVFASSGFGLDAAEVVCSTESVSRLEVLEHLDALVDKSVVQAEDTSGSIRYRLLETVREYALVKLSDQNEVEAVAARMTHRDHYLVLAETADPCLRGPHAQEWLHRLSVEQDNLRTALAECLRDPDPEPGLRLATALNEFWRARGHGVEGASMLAQHLHRPNAQAPTLLRGHALVAASDRTSGLGDYVNGMANAEEALTIARDQHDDRLAARALEGLAWSEFRLGQLTRSLAHSDEAVVIARSLGDHQLHAGLLACRGAALGSLGGDPRPDFEEGLALARQAGWRTLIAGLLGNLGYQELIAGNAPAARGHWQEALAIYHDLGEPQRAAFAAMGLGFVYHLEHEPATASSLLKEALEVAPGVGDPETVAYALLGLALTSAEPETAAILHGAADAALGQIRGIGLDPLESRLRETDHQRLRTALGEQGFEIAYNAGSHYHREDAITFALSSKPPAIIDSAGR